MTTAAQLPDVSELVVRFADEQGLPLEFSIARALEGGCTVTLIGLMIAVAARPWGRAKMREVMNCWADHHAERTLLEIQALELINRDLVPV